jgi:hypothetical protein
MSSSSDDASRLNLEILKNSTVSLGGKPSLKGAKSIVQDEEMDNNRITNRQLRALIQESDLNEIKAKPLKIFKENFQKVLQQKIEVPLLFTSIIDFMNFLNR